MPIFDAASLRTAVADTLRAADVGANTNALVAVVTRDAAGHVVVRGAISTKIADQWTVTALVELNHEKRISGGIEVKATW